MTNRWWIYQKERFPIVQNGLLAALLGTSAVGYSLLLRQPSDLLSSQNLGAMALASLVTFLFFLQQQIIEEFSTFPVDVVQHPNRAVPRGLVSLQALQILGLAAGLIQFGLALPIGFGMVLLLGVVWAFLLLLSGRLGRSLQGFKVAKSRVWYRLGCVLGWAVVALYATAQDWLAAKIQPNLALGWFLLVSFGLGLVVELSRNLWVATSPTTQAQTRSAILRWLLGVWLLTLAALLASAAIQFVVPTTLVVLSLLVLSSLVAVWFWQRPALPALHLLKLITALWAVGVYFNLSILPLLLR
jgi:hypothetical protein